MKLRENRGRGRGAAGTSSGQAGDSAGSGGHPWPVFFPKGFEDKCDPTIYCFIFGALTGQGGDVGT